MRCRLAHIVTLAACLCAEKSSIHAQSSASTAGSGIRNEGRPCQASTAPDDRLPSGPQISITEVTFSGALQLPNADQDRIADEIKQRTYGDSLDGVTNEALERVRAGWQNRGFFKVEASGEATILTSSPVSQRIALRVHVDEGPQYSLGEITFKNNKAISSVEALRGLFPIKDGEIFSREKIAQGLGNLRETYGELGYLNFNFVPDTIFDDENKLISVEIDFSEGKQFYVSRVRILGLDEPTREELLGEFPMKPGQIYNGRLFAQFLLKHASMFSAPDGYGRTFNERAGTVAITFDLRPCLAD